MIGISWKQSSVFSLDTGASIAPRHMPTKTASGTKYKRYRIHPHMVWDKSMFQHVHLAGVKQYYYHPWQGCYQAEIHAQIPLILTLFLCFQFSGDAGFLQAHPPMGIAITALVIINVSFYILIKFRIFFTTYFRFISRKKI